MKVGLNPRYQDFFGDPNQNTYNDLLIKMPSKEIIIVLLKLYALAEKKVDDFDILNAFLNKCDRAEREQVLNIYQSLLSAQSGVKYAVFAEYYLLRMISREVKRDNNIVLNNLDFDYLKLFKAYLLSFEDSPSVGRSDNSELVFEGSDRLKHIWVILIEQFELGERIDGVYDRFRFLNLVNYLSKEIEHIRQFVRFLGFTTLNEFWKMFVNIDMALSKNVETKSALPNLFSVPEGRFSSYLSSISINNNIGLVKGVLSDIRKYPVYMLGDTDFLVINRVLFEKKMFKEFLFLIFEYTDINLRFKNLGDFKSKVSKEVFERKCFIKVLKHLITNKPSYVKEDDNTQGLPDLYLRYNENIFLIEFKDYLFSDEIINSPSGESIESYIKKRFVKPKGVKQIVSYIESIKSGKYSFDKGLNVLLSKKKRLKIVPIICYTEYNFSMPGINDYVNNEFKLSFTATEKCSASNLTMINLKDLLALHLRDFNFKDIVKLIVKYWDYKEKASSNISVENIIKENNSFEEYCYRIIKSKEITNLKAKLEKLFDDFPNMIEVMEDSG